MRRAFLVLFCCLYCAGARAQEARLSDRGRLLVAGAVGGSWSNNDDGTQIRLASWSLWASPSALYFLRDQIGLGAYASYDFERLPELGYLVQSHLGALGVQAGFELPLAPRIGWLLIPQAGYARRTVAIKDHGARVQQRTPLRNDGLTGSHDLLQFGLFAPLIFHVTESLGFGFGPMLWLDVYLRPRERYTDDRYLHQRVGASSWIGASF